MHFKKNIFIYLCILFSFIQIIFAQNANYDEYIPSTNTPIKNIKLYIHVFNKDDGTGNFQNNETDHEKIKRVIIHMNDVVSNLTKPNLGIVNLIKDARIRFLCDKGMIFFHNDSYGHDFTVAKNPSLARVKSDSLYRKYIQFDNSVPKDGIHIYWGEGQKHMGQAYGIGSKKWLYQAGAYQSAKENNHWDPAALLLHEIGHCLGLLHTTEYNPPRPGNDGCDDTPTWPENTACWNGDSCTNNVMDYNACRCALTPCQLSKIHWYLNGNNKGCDIHLSVKKDWCEFDSTKNYLVSEGDLKRLEWNLKIYGNLILEKNSTFEVNGSINMPKGSKIILNQGSKLVLKKNAKIINECGDQWSGIEYIGKNGKNKGKIVGEQKQISNCINKIEFCLE